MAAMLCGDEVCASVCDLGSSLCRFGIAGQDTPRHIFRTDVGRKRGEPNRYIVGDSALRSCVEDLEICHPRQTNGTLNWDAVEAIMRYGIKASFCKDSCEVPILITDSLLSTTKEKEEMIELCLESLNSPACYLAPSSMLSAFSSARPTALVMEMGTHSTRIRPIVDGYGLQRAYLDTNRGGAHIDTLLQQRAESGIDSTGVAGTTQPVSFIPQYEVLAQRRSATKPNATDSYRKLHVKELVGDLKKWCCFIPYKPLPSDTRGEIILSLPIPPFELPDGKLISHRDNICTIPEELWFPSSSGANGISSVLGETSAAVATSASSSQTQLEKSQSKKRTRDALAEPTSAWVDTLSISELMYQSLLRCDPDTRRELCANVVVCGGGALIDGLAQRLSHEMSLLLPSSIKFKIAPQLPIERLHSAWIGGSILSICGAFQQLWVSKGAYAELGAAGVVRDKFHH